MTVYSTFLTTVGQQLLAAAATGGAAPNLTHMAVGDGNGADYDPVESQTALVREVYRMPVGSQGALTGGVILLEGYIPENQNDASSRPSGGWHIREVGVFTSTNQLFAIARYPTTYKPLPSDNAVEDKTVRLLLDIGNNGNVSITINPSQTIHFGRLLRLPWIGVNSATLTAPPSNPTSGDTYRIPSSPSATGAWVGRNGQIAQWIGSGWVFSQAANGTCVWDQSTDTPYIRDGGVWRELRATEADLGFTRLATVNQAIEGKLNNVAVTPRGLRAALYTFTPPTIYNTPGSFTFTVPEDAPPNMHIRAVGAGAGGSFGAAGSPSGGGCGGGSGAAGEKYLSVQEGDVIDGTIPAGGAAGVAGTNPGNGGDLIVRHKRGGSTLWTGTLQGGRAGINANAGTAVNAASGGSAGSGWDRAKNGRSSEGGLLIGSYPTKAGPGANAPFDFGDGGKAGTGAGDDGQDYGSGGGGSAAGQVAGAGAPGCVEIYL